MIVYPDGYGTSMLAFDQVVAKHGPKMHPEFKRRFFAYLKAKDGLLGVGGGWRSTSQISAASAAGKSFHQDQRFASGFVGYAAVDLVTTDGPDANNSHDGVTWAMTADAWRWGLHTFIKVPNEPWHIQCVEMRGWQTWVDLGRPDPPYFVLPRDPAPTPPVVVPPITTTPIQETDDMLYIIQPTFPEATAHTEWLVKFEDGHLERALGSTLEFAKVKGVPIVPEESAEHYQYQLARRVLPPMRA